MDIFEEEGEEDEGLILGLKNLIAMIQELEKESDI
jgi:hypothetical protein